MPVKNLYDLILLGVYSEIHLPKMYTIVIVIVIIPNQAFQPNTMSYAFLQHQKSSVNFASQIQNLTIFHWSC